METPILDKTEMKTTFIDVVDRWEGEWLEWEIELTYLLEVITVNFYTHSQSTTEPVKRDVVYALAADDATIQQAASFNEWCDELGYDNDSITDRELYNVALANSAKIRNLYKYYYPELLEELEDA